MPARFDRRRALAAIGAGAAWCGARQAAAIEPIARGGGPKFKFSLAAYSYRNLLTGKAPKLTLEDFIADCAKMNLEGTELTSYYFPQQPAREYLNRLKQLVFRLGLDVSGTAVGNDFCHPPGKERDEQIAHVKRWVEHAASIGAPVVRIFAGTPRNQSTGEAHRLVVEAIEQCCQHAGEHGVYLALENHGGLTERAADVLSLVQSVKSAWFGVNLDTGNFHSDDIYADLASLVPYAVNVQVKVVVSGPDGRKTPTDFSRLAKILAAAGYRGYVVLEYEEDEDPRTACPRFVDQMRRAFSA